MVPGRGEEKGFTDLLSAGPQADKASVCSHAIKCSLI